MIRYYRERNGDYLARQFLYGHGQHRRKVFSMV